MTKIFLLFAGFAAIFIWWTSGALPESVASHFGPGGVADGFMTREAYARFMVCLVVVVPSLVFFVSRFAQRLPVALINLPNKSYWLAPERQQASLASLGRFGAVMAYATALLLCLVHFMVVQANKVQPPHLEAAPLVGVMGLFFAVLGVAMVMFIGRFFRVPSR
jgi:serine/threonine-protein kinase